MVVVNTINPIEAAQSEFKATQDYRARSKIARGTQRSPVMKKKG